jgi:hypothetical protein
MKRRNFFKKLGMGTAAVMVAPMSAMTDHVYEAEIVSRNIKQEFLESIFDTIPMQQVHGNLYVRLYDIDGKEATFDGYTKGGFLTLRNPTFWKVQENYVENNVPFEWPECQKGPGQYIAGVAITDASGRVLFKSPLSSFCYVEPGVTVQFAKGSLNIEET